MFEDIREWAATRGLYERGDSKTQYIKLQEEAGELAKALLTYETLTGDEIENLINKNIHPANKEDLKTEDNNQDSALGSIGLKPKIVH